MYLLNLKIFNGALFDGYVEKARKIFVAIFFIV